MKRYFMMYESDRIICGTNDHLYGYASSLKTAKAYIPRCKELFASYNPRNFRIYDSYGDIQADTNFVPCVHQEI